MSASLPPGAATFEQHEQDTTNVHGFPDTTQVALLTDPEVAGYEHDQAISASVWTIDHNLGYRPTIVGVIDTAGTQVIGRVEHPTTMRTVLTFSAPFSGKARLR